MRKSTVDVHRLQAASARLGDAAIDPALWPEIIEQISGSVGAVGAALLQSDIRTPDIPRTPGVAEMFKDYFGEGWHTHDVRAERGVPLLLGSEKVIIDQDILTADELKESDLYNYLGGYGLKWWAAIGFRAGSAHWALSIQRTRQQGPFERADKRFLISLADRLTETATLSKAVGRVALTGMTNALHLVCRPAIALDRFGFVLDTNVAAEQLFDDEVRISNRRLRVRDREAEIALNALIEQLRAAPDTSALPVAPIVVKRESKQRLLIRILPVDGAARSPFLGARALLVFSDLYRKPVPLASDVLRTVFGLSRAEAKLAAFVGIGESPEQAAERLGITRETARNQLKAIFAKTNTHRQSELVALLARLWA